MPNNEFVGRRVSVGFGIESTYGVSVAPTIWARQMKLGFQRKTTTIDNTSAMGRNEVVNDSAVVEQWADGPFKGKVYDLTIGYLLANWFGDVVTTDNADSNPVVKDHTGNISQSNVASKSLTVTRTDPISTRRHAMATIETLEITVEQGQWVMVNGNIMALPGVTASDVAGYTPENSFTSKHVTFKNAANLAGLAGATPPEIKSLKLTFKRTVTKFIPMGATEPTAFNVSEWRFEGEAVLRYTANTLESLWYANTPQALQIAIVNTDVTIGASARPSLVFTAPKARFNTFDMSDDLDTVVEQTVGFKGELDTVAGYMIRYVLTNTQASY